MALHPLREHLLADVHVAAILKLCPNELPDVAVHPLREHLLAAVQVAAMLKLCPNADVDTVFVSVHDLQVALCEPVAAQDAGVIVV